MGFVCSNSGDKVVTLDSDYDNGVNIMIGGTCIAQIDESGNFSLVDYVDSEDVGNLKLTESLEDCFGDFRQRARIFFEDEELILPSEQKKTKPKAKKS